MTLVSTFVELVRQLSSVMTTPTSWPPGGKYDEMIHRQMRTAADEVQTLEWS